MKRVSYVLLLGLMLFMTIGSAAAKTRSHKKPTETLVDQQPGPAVRSTPIKKEKKDTWRKKKEGQLRNAFKLSPGTSKNTSPSPSPVRSSFL